jgi:hypothetical protein
MHREANLELRFGNGDPFLLAVRVDIGGKMNRSRRSLMLSEVLIRCQDSLQS